MVVPLTRKCKSVGYRWGLSKRLTTQPSSCNNTAIFLGTFKKTKVQSQLSERELSEILQKTTVTRKKKSVWSQAYLAFTIFNSGQWLIHPVLILSLLIIFWKRYSYCCFRIYNDEMQTNWKRCWTCHHRAFNLPWNIYIYLCFCIGNQKSMLGTQFLSQQSLVFSSTTY